jgi:hypothetical protein
MTEMNVSVCEGVGVSVRPCGIALRFEYPRVVLGDSNTRIYH